MHRILNRLWRMTCRREAAKFQRELSRPREAQAQTLSRCLHLAAGSEWGRSWKLSPNTSVDAFRRAVPLSDYDDYRDAVEQIDRSGINPLTSERVILLEPTSGTSSDSRIPEGALTARRASSIRRRASQLLDSVDTTPELTKQLWPSLAGISCWTDGASHRYVADLQQAFSHAEIFPKGLLSTEGCVSIPLLDQPGGVLALRSHFLEFLPEDHAHETLLADQLSVGEQYQVVITTGGGFYRYRTGDWVKVSGRVQRCPLIRFVGREATSDLVGEKLNDRFVQTVLERLFEASDQAAHFALLVPDASVRCYRLYAEMRGSQTPRFASILSQQLDQLLSDNPYYLQARQLGQLEAARVAIDTTGGGFFRQQLVTAGNRHQ